MIKDATISLEETAVIKAAFHSLLNVIDISKLEENQIIAITIATAVIDRLKVYYGSEEELDQKIMEGMFDTAITEINETRSDAMLEETLRKIRRLKDDS